MLTSLSSPDLHLLRVFVTVAEFGGFSRAQIALNVSQSTISTQMIDLETRLGMRLCRRGRAGFALTEEGQEIYQIAKALLGNCEDFVGRVKEIRGEVSGELRIATADALLGNPEFPYARLLSELREQMPAVSLRLSVLEPLEIERQVLEQKLHLGIHTFPNHAPGLRYVHLFGERQDLYCGKGHPLFDAAPGDIDIDAFDYVSRTYYGGVLRPGQMRPQQNSIHSGNMEGVAAAILSGKFIGHLPRQSAATLLEAGAIKPIGADRYSYETSFEAVLPAGARLSRAQKILEEILTKLCKEISA
ncbi:LysR family transcriptional regulator [Ruegeria sp.]|uniref:LysR family transcriptional regulator n=1 Tax=Ruegeria sp. TaxID=1879320 RepID=UPI00231C520F|nr:LysR family transcriptional regulator [Ruegeria sp.]MDA7965335.1 LysR family transcriptional regulator [Ruegeria sp.]